MATLHNVIETAGVPLENFNDAQAAAYLSTTTRTLKDWREKRGLPHIKLTHKTIIYRKSDLDGWLTKHLVRRAPIVC